MLYRQLRIFCLGLTLALTWQAAAAQGFLRDAEIESILREYTDPILEAANLVPEDVGLYVINDPSLNAFVAGGQRIHLHTGLIIRAETPSQLKGVIAHEAAHIASAHGARRAQDLAAASRSGFVSIGLGIIALAAGAPELGVALIANSQQITALNFFTHTRAQEASADQSAVNFLVDSGQSAIGLVEFFEAFRYQEVLSEQRRYAYFRTHPLASDRIARLRQRVAASEFPTEIKNQRDLHLMEMMQAKLIGYLEPPVRVYQRYPRENTSLPARYARAHSAINTLDFTFALKEADYLLEAEPDNPYFHELKGFILFQNGDPEASISPYARAVALTEGNALLLISYARSLIARDQPGDMQAGEDALREALIKEPDNAFAWSELAKALDKQGRRGDAELATAEKSFHIGDIVSAHAFAKRATNNLEKHTISYRRALDIAAVTDPRLKENQRYYRR